MQAKRLPIVVTAYNRPEHLRRTLASLAKCDNAFMHDIYVFVDGATAGDVEAVQQTLNVANRVEGFRRCIVTAKAENQGLASSVIGAVTEVIKDYRGVIVMEDDMLVNRYFLDFMSQSFDYYEDNPHIGVITGYTPSIASLPDTADMDLFASTRSSTWGWSMKRQDWLSINWDASHFETLMLQPEFIRRLEQAGNDRSKILRGYLSGKLDVWGIRRGAWQIENQKLTLYPKRSLLTNIGLDGSGVNCRVTSVAYDLFDPDFNPSSFPDINAYAANERCEALLRQFYSR